MAPLVGSQRNAASLDTDLSFRIALRSPTIPHIFETVLETSGRLSCYSPYSASDYIPPSSWKRSFAPVVFLVFAGFLNHTYWEGQEKPGVSVYSSDTGCY